MANLVLHCRRHHWLVHEGGYSCKEVDGRVVYHDRKGVEVPRAMRDGAPQLLPRGELPESRWKEARHWVDRILEEGASALGLDCSAA